jgi:hypothetical protein
MKFIYVDESGAPDQGDVFVMAGLLIDAYRLRKCTEDFDKLLTGFLKKHPGSQTELKTKAFINGSGGWNKIDANERKDFLRQVCAVAASCARVFAVGLSFKQFDDACDRGHGQPFKTYWLGSAMLLASMVQKRGQAEKGNKGLTVFVCDDNKQEMASLSDALYKADPWYDPLYQEGKIKKNKSAWLPVKNGTRFDQIVNSAFAIKSQHSSLIQVSDAAAYIFRRHLELRDDKEAWDGEKAYYAELVAVLDERRTGVGRTPGGPCIDFYKHASHKHWDL